MARIDTLSNFLTDVADSIRSKTHKSDAIACEDFDTEIESISGGGEPNLQTKSITISQNGTTNVTPDIGYDGLSSVNISTEVPSGSQSEDYVLTLISDIPYDFGSGGGVAKGTDVYLFGGTSRNRAYKYDVLNETYTALTTIPYSFYDSRCIALVGDDIYLFGGSGGNTKAYKYNISTDTYTQLSDLPFNSTYGSGVSYGTDIYLFGSYVSGNYTKAYKYNTLTDTYTRLADVPFTYYNAQASIIGKFVYLMGSSYSGQRNYAYKYDIDNDTYTMLTNIPYDVNAGRTASCGDFVYIFGGNTQPRYIYKYDTKNDTYTKLRNLIYDSSNGIAINLLSLNRIYLITSTNKKTVILCSNQ